jgi:hypothetical protein
MVPTKVGQPPTQHGTNIIELGLAEFECAFPISTNPCYGTAAATANAAAIQNAASGLPASTTSIVGTGALILGMGNIF